MPIERFTTASETTSCVYLTNHLEMYVNRQLLDQHECVGLSISFVSLADPNMHNLVRNALLWEYLTPMQNQAIQSSVNVAAYRTIDSMSTLRNVIGMPCHHIIYDDFLFSNAISILQLLNLFAIATVSNFIQIYLLKFLLRI